MTFYLEVDNVQALDDNRYIVNVAGVSIVVTRDKLSDSNGSEVPDHVAQALVDIRLSTRPIAGWLEQSQTSNLSPSVPSGTVEPPRTERESEARTRQEQMPLPPAQVAPKSEPAKEVLFQVNEEAEGKFDWIAHSKALNDEYNNNPKTRRTVINRVAGMVRLDMLHCKDYFCQPLRTAVVNNILRRDALNTGLVPPDLAAFVDERPIHETLGSKGWDPGSDQAKDVVSPNWAASQAAQDNIASNVDSDEFAHMYASTEEMDIGAVASNAKNLFGSGK